MQHFLRLDAVPRAALDEIFDLADAYDAGRGPTFSGAAALFFPPGSLRTRISFERGLALMGLQPLVFPPETLDKPEDARDVAGYLSQWCDVAVVRHGSLDRLDQLAAPGTLPIVNAMTSVNHPCEAMGDLWAIRALGRRVEDLRVLMVGAADSNITGAWIEASRAWGFSLVQSCPPELRSSEVEFEADLVRAAAGVDVVVTDAPGPYGEAMAPYRVTSEVMASAGPNALLNPCPPFLRGREMDAELVDAGRWVGYEFKRALLPVQQAIVAWCLTS